MTAGRDGVRNGGVAARARRRVAARSAREAVERLQRILCDEARARIVQALSAGPLTVGELASVIERRPAGTSQHLRLLREYDVVERERRGTAFLYRLRPGGPGRQVVAALSAAGG